jgi:hypothetical protein
MTWRIYRLPGSMQFLHIDSGQGTPVVNVRGFEIYAHCQWGQNCGAIQPRGWIEIEAQDFYIIDDVAIFFDKESREANKSVNETLKIIDAAPCMVKHPDLRKENE